MDLTEEQKTDQPERRTFQSLLLDHLVEADLNFILNRLAINGYGIFDVNQLNQDLNNMRQIFLNQLSEDYIFVSKADWENIKKILDAHEQQQRTDNGEVDNLSPRCGADTPTRISDGEGVSDIAQAND